MCWAIGGEHTECRSIREDERDIENAFARLFNYANCIGVGGKVVYVTCLQRIYNASNFSCECHYFRQPRFLRQPSHKNCGLIFCSIIGSLKSTSFRVAFIAIDYNFGEILSVLISVSG